METPTKRIKDMEIGEIGYTQSWAIIADYDGNNFRITMDMLSQANASDLRPIKIKRMPDNYLVEIHPDIGSRKLFCRLSQDYVDTLETPPAPVKFSGRVNQ